MKRFKIFLFNFLLFLSLLIIFDFCSAFANYTRYINDYRKTLISYGKNVPFRYLCKDLPFKYKWKITPFKEEFYKERKNNFQNPHRITRAESTKKPSIIIFGCSFGYGFPLEYQETPAYKISKITNRTVYNRAFIGHGLNAMLWQTRNEDFYKDIDVEPEYAIYLFITDHIFRIFNDNYVWPNGYSRYEIKNNNLVEKYSFINQFRRFHISRKLIQNYIMYKNFGKEENQDKIFDLLKLYFESSRKELQKKYPNIKFIIIKHPAGNDEIIYKTNLQSIYNSPRWKELEDEGFIIYDIEKEFPQDFTDKELMRPDKHPSAKAWDIFTEKFVKDLNL